MTNLPILKHISEALNLEVRVSHRDDDTKTDRSIFNKQITCNSYLRILE